MNLYDCIAPRHQIKIELPFLGCHSKTLLAHTHPIWRPEFREEFAGNAILANGIYAQDNTKTHARHNIRWICVHIIQYNNAIIGE